MKLINMIRHQIKEPTKDFCHIYPGFDRYVTVKTLRLIFDMTEYSIVPQAKMLGVQKVEVTI